MVGGCGGPIEYGSVQKVDGGLRVHDLEHLPEQGAQLLRRHLSWGHSSTSLGGFQTPNPSGVPRAAGPSTLRGRGHPPTRMLPAALPTTLLAPTLTKCPSLGPRQQATSSGASNGDGRDAAQEEDCPWVTPVSQVQEWKEDTKGLPEAGGLQVVGAAPSLTHHPQDSSRRRGREGCAAEQ